MALSPYPSRLVVPHDAAAAAVLPFLCRHFPRVAPAQWRRRFAAGLVMDEHMRPLAPTAPVRPGLVLYYYRELDDEVCIPAAEEIIHHDADLLVACKPHFLPVTPGGRFVSENLLFRLRQRTGNHELVPLHRIDRHTAGLVLFSCRRVSRSVYAALFSEGRVKKTYLAAALCPQPPRQWRWEVANRIERGEPWFRRRSCRGAVNARSVIRLVQCQDGIGLFELQPITGKTHQLRVHMSDSGFPILNDRYYPRLLPEQADDYDRPLQLLAKSLSFTDPVTGKRCCFESPRALTLPSGLSDFP